MSQAVCVGGAGLMTRPRPSEGLVLIRHADLYMVWTQMSLQREDHSFPGVQDIVKIALLLGPHSLQSK